MSHQGSAPAPVTMSTTQSLQKAKEAAAAAAAAAAAVSVSQGGGSDWEIGGEGGSEDGDADSSGHEASSPTGNSSPSGAAYRAERAPTSRSSGNSLSQRPGNITLLGGKGITSSPSFQELERAIGESLAMNLTTSSSASLTSLGGGDSEGRLNSRLSGTDLTLQKAQSQRQQRIRQQPPNQHRYSPSQMLPMQPKSPNHLAPQQMVGGGYPHHMYPQQTHSVKSPVDARTELAVHINESESRALILFHSPDLSPLTVRDACQKFGVLYYIRPEFHSKGVTLLSYFDLREAIRAQSSLPQELQDDQASAHFSIMLHATNSNTEEYRLVVQNLPEGRANMTEIQAIFERYGTLRSIQRIFSDAEHDRKSTSAFSIEYFGIQDARLAASELGATTAQLWGPEIVVGFAPLDTRKQLLCRQLLGTLSRWRSELLPFPVAATHQLPPMMFPGHEPFGYRPSPMGMQAGYHPTHGMVPMTVPMPLHPSQYSHQAALGQFPPVLPHHQMQTNAPPHQPTSSPAVSQGDEHQGGALQQQLPPQAQPQDQHAHLQPGTMPVMNRAGVVYPPPVLYDNRPQHHNSGHGRRTKMGGTDEPDFTLSIDKLKIGEDTRTTVMVSTRALHSISPPLPGLPFASDPHHHHHHHQHHHNHRFATSPTSTTR